MKKIKVFVLADSPLAPSGVAGQTRYMIEGLLKTNVKLFEDYERLLKLVDKETNEGSTKGGAEESASEKGLI